MAGFEYIWAIRASGTNPSSPRSVEYGMIPDVRKLQLLPLLEVTDQVSFIAFVTRLRSCFGTTLVDIPQYLLDYGNRFRDGLEGLLKIYGDAVSFLTSFRKWIDVPVASSRWAIITPDYSAQTNMVRDLKKQFNRVAVRLFLPQLDIRQLGISQKSYSNLLRNLPDKSIILLDVPEVTAYESVVAANISEMSREAIGHGFSVYVLNAMDPEAGGHNYGPYFSHGDNLKGFGDLATERRFPMGGGGYPTAVIKYYDFDGFVINEFRDRTGYQQASQTMRDSQVWQKHNTHRSTCSVCLEVERASSPQLSARYWKQFRIQHYLNSIDHETRALYTSVRSAQDLDPDGHHTIVQQSPPNP